MAVILGTNRQKRPPNSLAKEQAQGFSDAALAPMHVPAALPFVYAADAVLAAVVGNDANDPNTTEPTNARTLICSGPNACVSHIGIWPIWPVAAQAVVLHVWCKTGLTTAGAKWVRVAKVNFAGTTDDLETQVAVGYRDTFIQVVSGADAGHPLSLAVAAC